MKTLDEHNQDKILANKEARKRKHLSGIACPKCKTEMIFPRPYEMLLSDPPQKTIECPECGYNGYMIL